MPGILSGVRVVDFSRIFAGPMATQILGDLGADVIKVEQPEGGDEVRGYGTDSPDDISAGFVAFNRNKRSVALDLNTPAGRAAAQRLAGRADVIVENFRTGVMRRWDLDYSSVRAINPAVVYCSISGFGTEGPLATKAANDVIIQAYSGLMSVTGHPGDPPVRCPAAIADLPTGVYAALGAIAGLFHRERFGQGQHVELSLLGSLVSLMGHLFADYLVKGNVPRKLGSAVQLGLPNQAFPTADGWVILAAVSDRMWLRLTEALDAPELGRDPRFAVLSSRYEHGAELVEELSARTVRLDTTSCVARLSAAGVSCSPIRDVPEVAADPLLASLGQLVDVSRSTASKTRVIGSPLRFSTTPVTTRLVPPLLGEHTDEVLAEMGLTGDHLESAPEPVE